MHLGVFWGNTGGCQNHLQTERQKSLALTPWGCCHRALTWKSVKRSGSFPLPPKSWPAFISMPQRGRRRSEVAGCLSPSKQRWNSLAWLFSNPLPAGHVPCLWELGESHLRIAFGPHKPWRLQACACQLGGAAVQLPSEDHIGWRISEASEKFWRISEAGGFTAAGQDHWSGVPWGFLQGWAILFPCPEGSLQEQRDSEAGPAKKEQPVGSSPVSCAPDLRESKWLFHKPSNR